jgi:cytochrome c
MYKKTLVSLCFIAGSLALKAQVPADIQKLLTKNTCNACHKLDDKLVGPSFKAIAAKKYTAKQMVGFMYKPEPSHWPSYPPMAALPALPKSDAAKISKWITTLGE